MSAVHNWAFVSNALNDQGHVLSAVDCKKAEL